MLDKLSAGMGKDAARKLKEMRISVMNHDKKTREKHELMQVNDIITSPERPTTANCYSRKDKWITEEKSEVKIFSKPRLSTHAYINTAARQITSTDVDQPPQSVTFVRSSSVVQPQYRTGAFGR